MMKTEHGGGRALTAQALVKWGFIVVTIVLFAYFAATIPAFRTSAAIMSMMKFTTVTAILGLGLTFSMVVGGMDMSIGSTAGLGVQLAAMTMVFYNMNGVTAVFVVLVAGVIVGLLNAVLVVLLKIPDLLATLAMMFVIQGVKLIPVQGQSVSSGMIMSNGETAPGRFTDGFLLIDRGTLGPIPFVVILTLLLTVASWIFLSRTRWGRVMYSVGSNPEAARLAGVKVGQYRALAYVISSVFASIGGIVLASRIGQGDVNAGSSALLEAVAVALVGTSVLGLNKPNAWGTLLGAVLIGIVLTGLTMNGFAYYIQDTSKGVVLLVGLVFAYTLSTSKSKFKPAV